MSYTNLTDFNSADVQGHSELIPANTLTKVTLNLKPGGHGPEGWMTKNHVSGAIYLNSEFIILEGPYAKRRVYKLIGIKGTTVDENGNDLWGNMGRSMIRAILESARNIKPQDQSAQAQEGRRIQSIGDLNGLVFAVKIGIEHNKSGSHPDKNKIASVITPDHKDYRSLMNQHSSPSENSVPAENFAFSEEVTPSEDPAISVHSIPSWVHG